MGSPVLTCGFDPMQFLNLWLKEIFCMQLEASFGHIGKIFWSPDWLPRWGSEHVSSSSSRGNLASLGLSHQNVNQTQFWSYPGGRLWVIQLQVQNPHLDNPWLLNLKIKRAHFYVNVRMELPQTLRANLYWIRILISRLVYLDYLGWYCQQQLRTEISPTWSYHRPSMFQAWARLLIYSPSKLHVSSWLASLLYSFPF